MTWQPERFTSDQRLAAAQAVVFAQSCIDRAFRSIPEVSAVLNRVDGLLAMIHEDIFISSPESTISPRPRGS